MRLKTTHFSMVSIGRHSFDKRLSLCPNWKERTTLHILIPVLNVILMNALILKIWIQTTALCSAVSPLVLRDIERFTQELRESWNRRTDFDCRLPLHLLKKRYNRVKRVETIQRNPIQPFLDL